MPLSQPSHQGEVLTALTLSNITLSPALHQNNVSAPEGCLVFDIVFSEFIPWDNPDNIISQETEQAVDTAVGAVCLPILFLISVPGNILNMLVFWKQGLKQRVNLCLFYMSLVDFFHMLSGFFMNVDRPLPPFTQAVGPVFEFILDHKLVGMRGFSRLSGFISMLIACERCLCVTSPLRSQTILKTRTTAVILTVASVLIMSGSMLIGLRWDLICVFNPATNITSRVIYISKFFAQNKSHLDGLTFFLATLQPLTYVNVVMATTIVASIKLKKLVAWREQTSSSTLSLREVALTRTLIAVSILYIVCSLPTVTAGICVIFVRHMGPSGRYYNISNLIVTFLKLGAFINASFNFFLYCFLGSKYRETLRSVFICTTRRPC